VTNVTVWNGSDRALDALKAAVRSNCACSDGKVCSSHQLLTDQRTLDHLAFVASRVTDYIHGEFDPVGEWF
jgi:hypothetical protein